MKIVIGIPVLGQHTVTEKMLGSLFANVTNRKDVTFVIIDNGSHVRYKLPKNVKGFTVVLIRNKENKGYYYPLLQLYEKYPDADIIGLMHNDLIIYDKGWHLRVAECFTKDKKLGLLGLCGSTKVDEKGIDRMMFANFPKDMIKKYNDSIKEQKTGFLYLKINSFLGLKPVVTLDSLCMFFRRECIPFLEINNNILLCHYYDKIWSFRITEKGYRVAILGISCMHLASVTSTSQEYKESVQKWLSKYRGMNTTVDFADTFLLYEGLLRYRIEYGDIKKMLPCEIDKEYRIHKL